MRETHQHQETAVEQVRRVRDHLNREIEATTGMGVATRDHRQATIDRANRENA